MKKTVVLLSMLAVLGAFTYSCISSIVNEDVIEEPPKEKDKIYFLRIALNSMTGESPFTLDWSNYQNVGFLLDDEQGNNIFQNRSLASTRESGNAEVLIVDTVANDATDSENGLAYAYAPYDNTLTGTELKGTLNANQEQLVNASNAMDNALINNMKLTANPVTFKIDQGTCQLSLRNVFSVIKLTIEDLGSILPLRTIQSVKLYIANKDDMTTQINSSPLAGSYSINLKNNNANAEFTSPLYAITATTKTNSSTMISNKPVFYFVVNPFSLKTNETLAVCIVTNRGDIFYSSFDVSPARNNIYALTASATEDNTYIATISDKYYNMYSNCYIISKKGKYMFPADKTMNGQVLTGATVDWLWASKEGGGAFNISELINPSNLIYDESRITFQVGNEDPFSTMKKGNVILALKDAAGEIVWSWHIWITDEPKDYLHEGIIFIDRNIGALTAEIGSSPIDNYGFVYQWGRKDPFFGGDGNSNESNSLSIVRANTILNTGVSWPNPSLTTTTAEMARRNPMMFICNNTASTNLNVPVDWLSVSSTPYRWSDTEKTDNDPCPWGYKTPRKTELMVLHNAADANDLLLSFKNQGNRYWEYYYYFDPTYGSTTTIWPTAGMRQGRYNYNGTAGARLLHSGTAATKGECYYWTSSPLSAGGTIIPGGSFRIYTSGNMLYSDGEFGDNADAYPIRCVKE